jgi:hypothetical protein
MGNRIRRIWALKSLTEVWTRPCELCARILYHRWGVKVVYCRDGMRVSKTHNQWFNAERK